MIFSKESGVDACASCSQYLVEIGMAPGCYGCDRELMLRRMTEMQGAVPQQSGSATSSPNPRRLPNS